MIYSISPWKAAKGHIMPGLCQVNNTWLEPTYYVYPWNRPQKSSPRAFCVKKVGGESTRNMKTRDFDVSNLPDNHASYSVLKF